jgi:uncharacterized protein DUF4956
MKRPLVRILVVFVVVLLGSALLVYALLERSSRGTTSVVTDRSSISSSQPDVSPGVTEPGTRPPANGNRSVLKEIFGIDETNKKAVEEGEIEIVAARVLLRFLIAAFLAMLLAFRWRRDLSITRRNPYVAQTQILLAVVAAAMMMIVGDSAARAFGIFAAASLVRFRTNIRDPKETTVLLICLGVGLACGVGRLDMAFILTIFVLAGLLILEYFESGQVFRAMELRVQTRNVDVTHSVLKKLFGKHGCSFELRQLEREPAEGDAPSQSGQIVYELNLGYADRTDQLTEEIMAEDSGNIAGLEWEQKKSSTYIYN